MSLFPRAMESERLQYEYVHPNADHTDAIDWYQYHREGAPGIEEATRYLSWDPHETPKETDEFLEHCGKQFDEGEGVTYAIYPQPEEDGAGEFAGTAGIDVDWDRRTGALGVWFRKPFWGRGYSGERAARMMELAFDRLDLSLVAVEHLPGNDKSRRAIEKYIQRFGGRREGVIRNKIVAQDGSINNVVRYSVSQPEWRESREE